MISRNRSTSRALTPHFRFAATAVAILIPLACSSLQAGRFFQSLGTGADSIVMLMTACAIICSSVILGRLAGETAARERWGGTAVCIGVWLAVVTFSTSTSALAILDVSATRIESETNADPAYRAVEASISANIASIEGLQAQIDGRDPVRWATQRTRWAEQIAGLQMQNVALAADLRDMRESGAGSTVADSFAKLARFGITRERVAVLSALLLDAIPFAVSMALGLIGGGVRQADPEVVATGRPDTGAHGKKPGRRPEAVAA